MASTLWFWIIFGIVILFFLFWMRRYLGRVILIFLFLFVLLFIYKWLNPVGAGKLWLEVKNFPLQITNSINQKILKNSITLTGEAQDFSLSGIAQTELNPQSSGLVVAIEEVTIQAQLSGELSDESVLEQGTGTLVEEEVEEEVYYLPSNPKPAKKSESSTSSALSSEDLREAREIFGN